MTLHMPDSKASGKSIQNCQSACSLDQTAALQSEFVPVGGGTLQSLVFTGTLELVLSLLIPQ